jgi:hypothetical protein
MSIVCNRNIITKTDYKDTIIKQNKLWGGWDGQTENSESKAPLISANIVESSHRENNYLEQSHNGNGKATAESDGGNENLEESKRSTSEPEELPLKHSPNALVFTNDDFENES